MSPILSAILDLGGRALSEVIRRRHVRERSVSRVLPFPSLPVVLEYDKCRLEYFEVFRIRKSATDSLSDCVMARVKLAVPAADAALARTA